MNVELTPEEALFLARVLQIVPLTGNLEQLTKIMTLVETVLGKLKQALPKETPEV